MDIVSNTALSESLACARACINVCVYIPPADGSLLHPLSLSFPHVHLLAETETQEVTWQCVECCSECMLRVKASINEYLLFHPALREGT